MGFTDKIKGMFNAGMDSDPDYIDDGTYNFGGYDSYGPDQYETQDGGMSNQGTGMSINSSALELKVIRPDRFDNVSQIADHLLNRRTVVLNLEATNKETSRRIIDFRSGVAYSISGNLKRVANNTFVITPNNVDVSNDAQEGAQKAAPKAPAADIYDGV